MKQSIKDWYYGTRFRLESKWQDALMWLLRGGEMSNMQKKMRSIPTQCFLCKRTARKGMQVFARNDLSICHPNCEKAAKDPLNCEYNNQ